MLKVIIEVTEVNPALFFKYFVAIFKIEASCNAWFDMTIGGEKANLIVLLMELGFGDTTDEAIQYIEENTIK